MNLHQGRHEEEPGTSAEANEDDTLDLIDTDSENSDDTDSDDDSYDDSEPSEKRARTD